MFARLAVVGLCIFAVFASFLGEMPADHAVHQPSIEAACAVCHFPPDEVLTIEQLTLEARPTPARHTISGHIPLEMLD